MEEDNEESEVFLCPGCQRPEMHKWCPAHGTPYYMSGQLFTEEMEKSEQVRLQKLLSAPIFSAQIKNLSEKG